MSCLKRWDLINNKEKNMNRLITFGCSFTYGHGLEDCLLKDNMPGLTPSQYAWPNILGKMLGREVINLSMSGASNQYILHKILSTNFLETDLVVTLWTHYSRDIIIFDKFQKFCNFDQYTNLFYLPIGNWMLDQKETIKELTDIIEPYYITHNDSDQIYKKYLTLHHAESYFKSINVNHFSFGQLENLGDIYNIMKFKHFYDLNIYKILNDFPKANDNSHPGIEGHQEIANQIYNTIVR